MPKPASNEFVPTAKRYVDLVPEGELVPLLKENGQAVQDFFTALPTDKESYRYAPGKWTPKQLLLHIIDAERVFAFRALTLGRGDLSVVFPNMEEEIFGAHADPSGRPMRDLLDEFAAVRTSSIFLFANLTEEQLLARGTLFGYPVTANGFGYILIGHALHHFNIIRERYL